MPRRVPLVIETALNRREPITATRVARHVTLVVLGAWALYLVVVHVVLLTPLLRWGLNRTPEKILVEYGRAWSVWPGRVHVQNLRVRVTDSSVEAYIAIDRLAATFDLPRLAKKQFFVRDVDASGASVIARPKLRPEQLDPHVMEGVASIPGLSDPPLEPPPKPPPEKQLWTVDLDRVRIEPLRELWIGPYRFHGDARVEGGFHLEPLRAFALRASSMDVRDGELTLAMRSFAHHTHGRLEAAIVEHDLRVVSGKALLRRVDAKLALESEVEDLGFLQRWVREVTVTGGAGHVKSDVVVRAGVLEDRSRLDVDAKNILVSHPKLAVDGDLKASIAVEGKVAKIAFEPRDVHVRRRFAESYPIDVPLASLLAKTGAVDLAERSPIDDLVVSVDVPSAKARDVRAFNDVVKSLAPGSATASLHLDWSPGEHQVQGKATFDAPRLGLSDEELRIAAGVHAEAEVRTFDLRTLRGELPRATLQLLALDMVPAGGEPLTGWWGRVDLSNGRLDVRGHPQLTAAFVANARDARPLVHELEAKGSLPSFAREPLSVENVSLGGRLLLGPGIGVESLRARGGMLSITGDAKTAKGKKSGTLRIALGPLSADVNVGKDGGGVGGGPR